MNTKYKKIITITIILIMILIDILYNQWVNSRVYAVNDNVDLLEMLNENVPNSIYIKDSVWGMNYITDSNIVNSFYEYAMSLPPVKNGAVEYDDGRLEGIVYFTSGDYIPFELGDYLIWNGAVCGNRLSRAELNSYKNLLKKSLYNAENLSNQINAQNKVQIRTADNSVRTLATDQKRIFRDTLLKSTVADTNQILERANQNEPVLFQVEIFTEETAKIPQIYIVIYKGGLCLAFDSAGNRSGSILQLKIDVDTLPFTA